MHAFELIGAAALVEVTLPGGLDQTLDLFEHTQCLRVGGGFVTGAGALAVRGAILHHGCAAVCGV